MKLLMKRILSLFPTNLPTGMTEFNAFADSIIELSGKYADEDSMRFAVASMIIHLGPQKGSAPKNFFVRSLRKSAANQVASQVFQDIKLKMTEQQAKQQAEAEANKDGEEAST